MKIVINALSARRGGSQTHLLNLLQHLDDSYGIEICIFAPDAMQFPDHSKVERLSTSWPVTNPLIRAFWEKFVLTKLLKKLKPDIFFCPGGLLNTAPPSECKTVAMFQNMIPFDPLQRKRYRIGTERLRNWLLEKLMLRSMIRADLVIFISKFALSIIENRAGKQLRNKVIIPHGLSENFKIQDNNVPPRPGRLAENEYLLYVSTFGVYRNQMEVIREYHILKQRRETRIKLVLVGYNNSSYGIKVRNEIDRLGLQNDVILTGEIPHKSLPSVYYHSKLIIFASECENCPNILLESLGAGRPMVVSNRQPMPEFAGDAVIYYDPSLPGDLSDKIISIIDDPISMQALSKKAREQSLCYDWKKSAHLTWNAIKNLHINVN